MQNHLESHNWELEIKQKYGKKSFLLTPCSPEQLLKQERWQCGWQCVFKSFMSRKWLKFKSNNILTQTTVNVPFAQDTLLYTEGSITSICEALRSVGL
jgi:hypothetical protein